VPEAIRPDHTTPMSTLVASYIIISGLDPPKLRGAPELTQPGILAFLKFPPHELKDIKLAQASWP